MDTTRTRMPQVRLCIGLYAEFGGDEVIYFDDMKLERSPAGRCATCHPRPSSRHVSGGGADVR